MTGRIEERDPLAGVLDAPGADHLRDAAGLGVDDVRSANAVEQARLAVIDVTHDRDDGRSRFELLLFVGRFHAGEQLLFGVLRLADFQLDLVVGRDELGHFRVDHRVDIDRGERHAQRRELLKDLRERQAERFAQRADSDRRRNLDFAFAGFRAALRLEFRTTKLAAGSIIFEDDHLPALQLHADVFAIARADVALARR